MSTQFEWKEEYNIGVEPVDKQHQELFQYINRLFQLTQKKWGWNNSRQSCRKGIEFIKKHAVEHFADEEAYMISVGYKGVGQHQRIHEGFLKNTIPALEQELKQTDYSPEAVEHFLGVCAGWLIGHTTMDDLSITGKNVRTWDHLLPGEEQTALRKAITQLMYDMFLLRLQMVSDSYRGKSSGRASITAWSSARNRRIKRRKFMLSLKKACCSARLGGRWAPMGPS